MVKPKRKYFTAVVLAAGRGVRMKSGLPKVLNELCGRPMIYYVLKELAKLKGKVKQVIVVVGWGAPQVKKYLPEHSPFYRLNSWARPTRLNAPQAKSNIRISFYFAPTRRWSKPRPWPR